MKKVIMNLAIILSLGFVFSNGAFAMHQQENFKSNLCKSAISDVSEMGRLRYVGYLYVDIGPSMWVNVYTDGYYYYWTFCDLDSNDASKEGCQPERLYKDGKGWYRSIRGEKRYLYHQNYNGDCYIVNDIEQEAHKR